MFSKKLPFKVLYGVFIILGLVIVFQGVNKDDYTSIVGGSLISSLSYTFLKEVENG